MPPMWRPGLSEDDKAKVLGSNRLIPISPRGGICITTPYGQPRAAGPRQDDDDAQDQDTNYTYDLAGRRTGIDYPDSGAVAYAFDGVGRLNKRTNQDATEVDYAYDDRGLMTSKSTSSPDIAEAYTYDGLGRMITAKKGTSLDDDATSETDFAYDDLSRLPKQSDSQGIQATAPGHNATRHHPRRTQPSATSN